MGEPAVRFEGSNRDRLFEEIVESVNALPDLLRKVFIRSHYYGQGALQISRELGIPQENAESMLQSANQIFYRSLHHFRITS